MYKVYGLLTSVTGGLVIEGAGVEGQEFLDWIKSYQLPLNE